MTMRNRVPTSRLFPIVRFADCGSTRAVGVESPMANKGKKVFVPNLAELHGSQAECRCVPHMMIAKSPNLQE